MVRTHLTISGKVQGVFFRASTKEKAEYFDITGFVANNADGTVTVVAEGSENKMNSFVDWCHSGPSRSEVKKVEIEKLEYNNEFEDFNVRY